MSKNILVFSIALNGYQWLYKDCILSHRRYAEKHGYRYLTVTQPSVTSVGVECCWLKLTLLLEALRSGYDAVFFIDADASVRNHTPCIQTLLRKNKYLYLAKGYSGRFNSGVILVRNHEKVQQWLTQVISRRHLSVEKENDVSWGENGHVIQQAKGCQFIDVIDNRWNNTYDPNLNDYIRHFSFGPLRKSNVLNMTHKTLSRLTRVLVKLRSTYQTSLSPDSQHDPLYQLTKSVINHYASFHRT